MAPLSPPQANRRHTVTTLLHDVRAGNAAAWADLVPLVYEELHGLAHHKLQFERNDHTLNTTALVHEAYERLVDQKQAQWKSRTHFFAVAAQAMRRILVNYAVRRKAEKRGGGVQAVPLTELSETALGVFSDRRTEEILALDEVLTRLEAFNPQGCRVIEYRFFGGLTYDEIAAVMGVSKTTVRRSWAAAKAWIQAELQA